jgi:hypothetical protein
LDQNGFPKVISPRELAIEFISLFNSYKMNISIYYYKMDLFYNKFRNLSGGLDKWHQALAWTLASAGV